MKKAISLFMGLLCTVLAVAQSDTLKPSFHINATMWSRGEIRDGALPAENGVDYAMFLMSNNVLRFDYAYKGMEARIAPKFFGVWGAAQSGSLAIDEAWFGLKHRSGLFFRVGRQKIEYDDERVIGSDDWSMAALTHDALKAGLERGKHKLHFLFAFNQNNENLNGGTYYVNGGQVYKSMQTLWYHVDPIPQLGTSLVFLNTGMQLPVEDKSENIVEYQQLFGAYADFHPKDFRLQASYYRQTGRDEHALPIHAWMYSAEADWQARPKLALNAGCFFMSGDENFFVPQEGALGLTLKKEVRGFNPVFGSHHEFYGAMDFFYVTTYYGGNTPGLQDYHAGITWEPAKTLEFDATYYFLATDVKVRDADSKVLGHEVELNVGWKPYDGVSVKAGYSFMKGTETMTILKRTSEKNRLQWGWLMLTVTPEFFSYKW